MCFLMVIVKVKLIKYFASAGRVSFPTVTPVSAQDMASLIMREGNCRLLYCAAWIAMLK